MKISKNFRCIDIESPFLLFTSHQCVKKLPQVRRENRYRSSRFPYDEL
jgi:hypothetical protein